MRTGDWRRSKGTQTIRLIYRQPHTPPRDRSRRLALSSTETSREIRAWDYFNAQKKKKKVRLCVETGRNARLLDECSLSLRALETQLNLGERFRPGFLLPGSSQPGQTTSSADDWHIWTIADKQTNK